MVTRGKSRGALLGWIPQHLVRIPRRPLLTPAMIGGLSRMDRRSLQAGLVGYRGH